MNIRRWIPLITALLGLVGGLFPGYGPAVIDAIKYRGYHSFSGEWSGAFKEWCSEHDCPGDPKWAISIEYMEIKQWGSRLSAHVKTEDLKPRLWDVSGRYRTPVLSMTYVEKDPAVMSVGSYVLESSSDCDRFHGFWTGYDRELKKIMTCPYVLVPGHVARRQIENDNDVMNWLRQNCFVAQN